MKLIELPSKENIAQILMICLFPVNAWALFVFFHDLPAYLMHYQLSEIAGILAYVLAFALLESILVAGILVFLASIFPKRWFLSHFISQGFVIISVTSIWWVVFQFWYWRQRVAPHGIQVDNSGNSLSIWIPMLLWLITYLAALISSSVILRQSGSMERILKGLADRFIVPSTFFLIAGLLGISIVILRNLP